LQREQRKLYQKKLLPYGHAAMKAAQAG
jgi:hypothetical protein